MKQVKKSNDNRLLAGICGGIAEYFNIDPIITRIIAVFLGFMSLGGAVLIYLILMVVLPEETERNQGPVNDYQHKRPMKEAEKTEEDDNWSDF